MFFPVLLPMLTATVYAIPTDREDNAEIGKDYEKVRLIWRFATRHSNDADKRPEICGSLPVKLNLKSSDFMGTRKRGGANIFLAECFCVVLVAKRLRLSGTSVNMLLAVKQQGATMGATRVDSRDKNYLKHGIRCVFR